MQGVSETFDVRVKKYENSRTSAKVSVFALHKPNNQSNHPKGKSWHIIFIIECICTRV